MILYHPYNIINQNQGDHQVERINIYIYILEDDKLGDHQIILTSTGRSPFLQCEAP